MSSPRQPGYTPAKRPPSTMLGTEAARVRCPTGRPRFADGQTARGQAALSRRRVAVACAVCGGWHVGKVAP